MHEVRPPPVIISRLGFRPLSTVIHRPSRAVENPHTSTTGENLRENPKISPYGKKNRYIYTRYGPDGRKFRDRLTL